MNASDTVLLLDNADIESVFDVDACLRGLETAYAALANGHAVVGPRSQTYVPLAEQDVSYCLKTMEGAIYDSGYMVLRLTSDIVSEAPVEGITRREKLPRGPGGTYCGLIVLFSVERLAPVAIMHDGFLQIFRVACTSALSARLLASRDAGDLCILGSGGQAWAHLIAMKQIFSLRRVRVFSPNAENREAFSRRAEETLGIEVHPVTAARAAVEGADLIVAATNVSQPVVNGEWIAKGAHVVSIVSGDQRTQRRELDDDTMRRAALVIAHSKKGAREQRHGDLWQPVEAGILSWEAIYDFPDLVAGRVPYQRKPDDITVFKNNGGLGLQFAAVAPPVYESARAAGIGRALPAAWFVEKLKA